MEEAISQAEQTLTEHERMASSRDKHSSWSSYYSQAAPRLRTLWDSRSSASSASSSSSSSSSSGPYVPEMSLLHTYPVLPNREEPGQRREYPRLSLFRIIDGLPATKSEEAHALPHPGGLRGGSSDSMTGYSDVKPMPRDTGSAFTREFDCDDYDQPSHYDRFDSDHSHDSRSASDSNRHRSLLYPQQHGPAITPNIQQQQQQQIEGGTPGKSRAERRAMTPEERRKARTCIIDGCANYIVHRHRCFRHGVNKNSRICRWICGF